MKKLILIIGLVSLVSLASASTAAERREPVNKLKLFEAHEQKQEDSWWNYYKTKDFPKIKAHDYKNKSDYEACKSEKMYAYLSSNPDIQKRYTWYKCEELK